MRARIILALGALTGCGGSQAPVSQAHAGPGWCIDPEQPGGTEISLAREGSLGVLETPEPVDDERVRLAALEDSGDEIEVTVGAGCGARPCAPKVLRTSIDGGQVLATTVFPGTEELHGARPFSVDWISIDDDNGLRDIWVSYTIVDAGKPSHRIAVFSLLDLGLRFTAAYGACDSSLHQVDADCDGNPDLVLDDDCHGTITATVFVRNAEGLFTPEDAP
jgi:hypothetical protein